MTDEQIRKLCAEAMGWKHLGAVGAVPAEGERGSDMDKKYPGKLWCLSGGNDWWEAPDGHSVCAVCSSIPDPLNDDAHAMALLKKYSLDIRRAGGKVKKWRIVEYRPDVYAVQREGWLWGWNYVIGLMSEMPIEFDSIEEAEKKMNEWKREREHMPRVVKEF